MQAASAFLAAIPNPSTTKTQLGTAHSDLGALKSTLATLSAVVTAMDATHLPAIKGALTTISLASGELTGFKLLVDDLDVKIVGLPPATPE